MFHVVSGGKVDTIAISLLVFTMAVFVLPVIENIKLPGGAELKFHHEAVKETAQILGVKQDNLVADISSLLYSFTSSMASTDAVLSRADKGWITSSALHAFARMKCADAITSSLPWFATEESVRVLAYQYDDTDSEHGGVLGFVVGNVIDDEDIALANEWFTLGDDDPVGRAWREQTVVNRSEALATDRPTVIEVPDEPTVTYRGIMFVPIRRDDEAWGMLIVERTMPSRFDATAEAVAKALGDVIVSALGHRSLRLGQEANRPRRRRRRPNSTGG